MLNSKKIDTLTLDAVNPIKLNESWALLPGLYNPKDPCIEIKINGNSLLHQLTYLSCRNAKSPSITTDFGHSTVFWLAKELDIRRKKNNPDAMLFCCIECGCPGCSTPICEITHKFLKIIDTLIEQL